MSQKPPPKKEPDVLLQRDRTRIVNTLEVVPEGNPFDSRSTFEPDGPSITLHASGSGNTGDTIDVRTTDGTVAGSVDTDARAGALDVADPDGNDVVSVSGSRAWHITVRENGSTQATVRSGGVGGRITTHAQQGGRLPTVELKSDNREMEEVGYGVVQVGGSENINAELRGRDALLDLAGPPANVSGDSSTDGGELIIQDHDTGTSQVSIQATAKESTDRGAANGNAPRIFLNGPEASVEVGRGPTDSGFPGFDGGIALKTWTPGPNTTLLSADVDAYGQGNRLGTLRFNRSDPKDVTEHGAVCADTNGLLVTDKASSVGGPNPAMLVEDDGEIKLAGSYTENALGQVGPRFVDNVVSISRGETGYIVIVIGDDDPITLEIGDSSRPYEISAEISPGSDARLWVAFDTTNAGSEKGDTLSIAQDATVTVTKETDLNNQQVPKTQFLMECWDDNNQSDPSRGEFEIA